MRGVAGLLSTWTWSVLVLSVPEPVLLLHRFDLLRYVAFLIGVSSDFTDWAHWFGELVGKISA